MVMCGKPNPSLILFLIIPFVCYALLGPKGFLSMLTSKKRVHGP